MVDHEPAVTCKDWWRAAADLELLPGLHGAGQSMMRGKIAEMIEIILPTHAAIGNPDTLPLKIHATGWLMACGFFGAGSRKQRPVNQCHRRMPGWIRDWDGKHAGVLIVHAVKGDAAIGMEGGEPETAPMEQILGNGDRNARPAL